MTDLFEIKSDRPAVISMCSKTSNMVLPWAEAGCECWCVDVQHSIRRDKSICAVCDKDLNKPTTNPCRCNAGVIHFVWGDARSWFPPRGVVGRLVAFFGFPPYTDLTCTGARDFQKKGGWALADGLQIFDSCVIAAEYSGAPFLIENPARNRLNTHRRQPDYSFHPWEYAGYLPDIQTDNTSKETGLWIGGGLIIPEKRPAPAPHREDCFRASPSDDRANERSVTPMGFARAVFEANKPQQWRVAA